MYNYQALLSMMVHRLISHFDFKHTGKNNLVEPSLSKNWNCWPESIFKSKTILINVALKQSLDEGIWSIRVGTQCISHNSWLDHIVRCEQVAFLPCNKKDSNTESIVHRHLLWRYKEFSIAIWGKILWKMETRNT